MTMQGAEFFKEGAELSRHGVVWAVRYSARSAAINEDDYRVQFAGKTYDIESVVDVDDAHVEIVIAGVRRD